MIYHSKGLDLEIAYFQYYYDLTLSCEIIPSQTIKHVEIVKVSVRLTYDTSLESS